MILRTLLIPIFFVTSLFVLPNHSLANLSAIERSECSSEMTSDIYNIVLDRLTARGAQNILPQNCQMECVQYPNGEKMCFPHAEAFYETCEAEDNCKTQWFSGYVSLVLKDLRPDLQ